MVKSWHNSTFWYETLYSLLALSQGTEICTSISYLEAVTKQLAITLRTEIEAVVSDSGESPAESADIISKAVKRVFGLSSK